MPLHLQRGPEIPFQPGQFSPVSEPGPSRGRAWGKLAWVSGFKLGFKAMYPLLAQFSKQKVRLFVFMGSRELPTTLGYCFLPHLKGINPDYLWTEFCHVVCNCLVAQPLCGSKCFFLIGFILALKLMRSDWCLHQLLQKWCCWEDLKYRLWKNVESPSRTV